MSERETEIRCRVNGAEVTLGAHPLARLLDVLRGPLRLTGTKEGCGEGECGACSVFIGGKIVNSCLVPLAQVEGASLVTIEGIASDDELNAVQEAFIETGGAQCGICTPGMVMAAVKPLGEAPHPHGGRNRARAAGKPCRRAGYMKIFWGVVRPREKHSD